MKRQRECEHDDDGNKDMNSLNCSIAATTTSNTTLNSASDVLLKGSSKNHDDDDGHRYGNFHNYYTFHPVSNRTEYLKEMLTFIANQWNAVMLACDMLACDKELFRYTDIGCNEGDLTLEIARLLSIHISMPLSNKSNQDENGTTSTATKSQHTNTNIVCMGLDLDADLIRRAQIKVQKDTALLLPKIRAEFSVLDVLNEDIELQQTTDSATNCTTSSLKYITDFTTIFSATMWIHIHGGDDGLRRVLQKLCSSTQYWILLEPQPSKCYGRVAFRLRRLGLPPLDVSNERLRLRPNIEDAIEEIMKEFSFERVKFNNNSRYYTLESEHKIQGEDSVETKTKWNRPLRLYQRLNTA